MTAGGVGRVVAAFLLGTGIVVWDQRDGEKDLPFLGATIIALVVVYGVSGLIWMLGERRK